MIYHMVMARRQVLVQLDDELIKDLDEIAQRHGVSRSEVIRRAAQVVIDVESDRQADLELQRAYRETPQDPALVNALWHLAAATMPEW